MLIESIHFLFVLMAQVLTKEKQKASNYIGVSYFEVQDYHITKIDRQRNIFNEIILPKIGDNFKAINRDRNP